MTDELDPYYSWLGIPPAEQPPDFYRLLGVARFECQRDVIANAADRQMVYLRTFQIGKHSALSQQILNEVAAARLCLLDVERKAAYDERLKAAHLGASTGAAAQPSEASRSNAPTLRPERAVAAPPSLPPGSSPDMDSRRAPAVRLPAKGSPMASSPALTSESTPAISRPPTSAKAVAAICLPMGPPEKSSLPAPADDGGGHQSEAAVSEADDHEDLESGDDPDASYRRAGNFMFDARPFGRRSSQTPRRSTSRPHRPITMAELMAHARRGLAAMPGQFIRMMWFPVRQADRLLGVLVGRENTIVHNFLRVVAPIVVVAGLATVGYVLVQRAVARQEALAVLEIKRERALAAQRGADALFESPERPPSYQSAVEQMAAAAKSTDEGELASASGALERATEMFGVAQEEAYAANAHRRAKADWLAEWSASDAGILKAHAGQKFAAVQDKATLAKHLSDEGQIMAATAAYREALVLLGRAAAEAANPLLDEFQRTIDSRDRAAAKQVLANLKQLIPTDARLTKLRNKFEAATGQKLPSFQGHTGTIRSVAFSRDGRRVLTGSDDNTAILWDAATEQRLCKFLGHQSGVTSVAFNPDGRQVLTGSFDHTAILWDAATHQKVRSFQGHTLPVTSVAISHDGRQVLTGSSDGTALLWDAATGQKVRTFTRYTGEVESVAFSPDDRHVLSGSSDYTATLWDASTGDKVRTFEGHTFDVESVAFSSDGGKVLTGAWDKSAILWNAATGEKLRVFGGLYTSAHSAAFSPDGRQVLTSTGDKTAILWNADTGEKLRTFKGHDDTVESVAFSPDGRQVLTGSADRTAILWDIDVVDSAPRAIVTPREIQGVDSASREFKNSIDMKFVLIPAGKFRMGSPPDENGRSANEELHRVRITRPFYLGISTVTQEEYERVMGNNPSYFSSQGDGKVRVKGQDTKCFPVEQVSFENARTFCQRLSNLTAEKNERRVYRLPTEAEWEYACRAGTTTAYHFGDSCNGREANCDGNFPFGTTEIGPFLHRTTAVGSFKPNGFGLCDMHGNVWEWCSDWYGAGYYSKSPTDDPQGPDAGSSRVLRGGGWSDYSVNCRSARGVNGEPGLRNNDIGFRVVLQR